jgi:hypothetical protein
MSSYAPLKLERLGLNRILLVLILLASVIFTAGCFWGLSFLTGFSKYSYAEEESPNETHMSGDREGKPGQRITQKIYTNGYLADAEGDIFWEPPHFLTYAEVQNIDFGGAKPEWDPEHNAWHFKVTGNAEINVSYDLPNLPKEYNQASGVSYTKSYYKGYTSDFAGIEIMVDKNLNSSTGGDGTTNIAWEYTPRLVSDAPAEEGIVWEIRRWLYNTEDMPLTAETCQAVVDGMAARRFFLAILVPEDTPGPDFIPPLLNTEKYQSAVGIVDYTSGEEDLISAGLDLYTEYYSFMEAQFPAPEGQYWLTVGPTGVDTSQCAGVNISGGKWEFKSRLFLRFAGRPDGYTGEVLPAYFCYAGEEKPPYELFLGMQNGLDAPVSSQLSFQSLGVTCIGPHPIPLLAEQGQLEWEGMHAEQVIPPQQVQMMHVLTNNGAAGAYQFETGSSKNLPWTLYRGSQGAPDMNAPISAPIELDSGASVVVWAVVDVPVITRPGPEALVLTAKGGGGSAWISDLLWIGEWVAPSGVPAIETVNPPTATPVPATATQETSDADPTTQPAESTPAAATPTGGGATTGCLALPVALMALCGYIGVRQRRR